MIYVKDVCKAVELVIENDRTIEETYNVSSDDQIRIREIVDILNDILDLEKPEKSYGSRFAYFLAMINEFLAKFGIKPAMTRMAVMFGSKSSSFPSDKLKQLGWQPSTSAEEMIEEWATWRKEFEEKRAEKAGLQVKLQLSESEI